MNEHLPECVNAMIPDFHNERWVCICASLRACEQRVEETWSAIAGRYQYAEGYVAALDAAREAVVSCHLRLDSGKILRQGGDWENAIDKACRAIDALQTKP